MARPTGRPVRDELIATATELISQHGVTGFSYGDLARELGIKAPSIHHHFKAKEDLVAAVAEQYRSDFGLAVDRLAPGSAPDRIVAYAELFSDGARNDKLCLCGAVSADWSAVGEASRHQVHGFFEDQIAWLETELSTAVEAGAISPELPLTTLATTIIAALEGSLLVSRTNGDTGLPVEVASLLATLIRPTQDHR